MRRRNFLKYLGIAPLAPKVVCDVLVERVKAPSPTISAFTTPYFNYGVVDPRFQRIFGDSPPLYIFGNDSPEGRAESMMRHIYSKPLRPGEIRPTKLWFGQYGGDIDAS